VEELEAIVMVPSINCTLKLAEVYERVFDMDSASEPSDAS